MTASDVVEHMESCKANCSISINGEQPFAVGWFHYCLPRDGAYEFSACESAVGADAFRRLTMARADEVVRVSSKSDSIDFQLSRDSRFVWGEGLSANHSISLFMRPTR